MTFLCDSARRKGEVERAWFVSELMPTQEGQLQTLVAELQYIDRKEARELGLTRYFIPKPCKRGHVAERSITSFQCRECYREDKKRYRAAAPKKFRRKANPELRRATSRNRKAMKRAAHGRHTAADVQRILLRQKYRCSYCKVSLKGGYHVDHITPLSKGGGNGPDNLQCLCPPCNMSKGAKTPEVFARQIGLLL